MVKRKSNVVQLPVPPVPVLTRPVGMTGGKGAPKAELRGFEASIDRIVEIRHQIESLEVEERLTRNPVESAAKAERSMLEAQTGKTIKSVIVHGTQQPARFTWRNSYRLADAAHEPSLRACLGPHFDTLFEVRTQLKVRDGSSGVVMELRKALGARFDAIFESTRVIAAKDELLEKRTVIRPTLTENQNTALDMTLEQLQASPSLSTK